MASLAASTATILAFSAMLHLHAALSLGWSDVGAVLGGSVMVTIFFFILGWPIALASALVLGGLVLALHKKLSRELSRPVVILCAAGAAASIYPFIWGAELGTRDHAAIAAHGAIGGLVGGACFWVFYRRHAGVQRMSDSVSAQS